MYFTVCVCVCVFNALIFSHRGEYGVTNIGKQELTLLQVTPHNDRVFTTGERLLSLPRRVGDHF